MLHLNQNISITTLTVNNINTPIKMQKLSDGIFKKTQVCAVYRKRKHFKDIGNKKWKNRCAT